MKKSPAHASSLEPILLVSCVTLALLVPFLTKAYHIDDTLFLKAAAHIRSNPLDFYGFPVNWYGETMQMSEVNQNPPLVSYLIALVSSIFGWSETALHGAFITAAVAATLGTWKLARSFCDSPATAAIILAVSPVFLVSSTNLMTDTTMLAFFIWGLALWVRGLETDRWQPCLLAALFISCSTLTKYFGITAVPLLVLLTLTRMRRLDLRLLFLLLPVAALFGFDRWSEILYGHGLLSSAAGYSTDFAGKSTIDYWQKLLTGLSFTGGCLGVFLFFIPFLYSRTTLLAGGAIGLAVIAALLLASGKVGATELITNGVIHWPQLIQLSIFILTGAAILGQSIRDCLRRCDGDSLFLLCWVAGTFIFTTFVNWTTNARTVLPLAPAVAILIIRQFHGRRLDNNATTGRSHSPPFWPLIPAAMLALAVAWADASLANSQRTAARAIMDQLASHTGAVWFQGHWGFQYYMEEAGARPIDFNTTRMRLGDIMVVPANNTNVQQPPAGFSLIKKHRENTLHWLGTMDRTVLGAGFYADLWGPQPYAFGPVPAEDFFVFSFGPPPPSLMQKQGNTP